MLSFACPSFVTARICFFDAHQSGMVTNLLSCRSRSAFQQLGILSPASLGKMLRDEFAQLQTLI
jgi:hypothetical protein